MTVPPEPATKREYDVALSFAGEDRSYVADVAAGLKNANVRVFYDDFEDLWGLNLYEHLQQVYNKMATFCVIFVSADYASKSWTRHEFEAAQVRALEKAESAYVLPVRLDDSEVPGLLSTVAYLDGRELSPSELVDRIIRKLGIDQGTSQRSVPSSQPELVETSRPKPNEDAGGHRYWTTLSYLLPNRSLRLAISLSALVASLVGLGIAISTLSGGNGGTNTTSDTSSSTSAPPSSNTTADVAVESPSTSDPAEPSPSLAAVREAVSSLPGDITVSVDGGTFVLDGFVADEAERLAAVTAVTRFGRDLEVENNLATLEVPASLALSNAGVVGASAVGQGTAVTVSGTVDTEADRQPALAAVAAVEGVTEILDRLKVSITADLNALPQVQFGAGSDVILPASFEVLDAATLLLQEAGDVRIEVQGYTDIVGSAAANLALSQARSESVRSYLVDAGVEAEVLSATGFGETTQFGDDLASNRLVRFQQVD